MRPMLYHCYKCMLYLLASFIIFIAILLAIDTSKAFKICIIFLVVMLVGYGIQELYYYTKEYIKFIKKRFGVKNE